MTDYIRHIEGDLEEGHFAHAVDINNIQNAAQTGLANAIKDIAGHAFILGSNPDSFIMTHTPDPIDQQCLTYDDTIPIQNYSVKQLISITKSSIEKVYVYAANSSGNAINVTAHIFDEKDNLLDKATITLAANSSMAWQSFNFSLHHLIPGDYYFKLVKTNVAGATFRVDNAGPYNNSLTTSVDDIEWTNQYKDLTFKVSYGNENTYDIYPGYAVINGERVKNTDTHVTIPARNGNGSRIDIITLNTDGKFQIWKGNVKAINPVAPRDKVPKELLAIAHVTVPSSDSNDTFTIYQDDTEGIVRIRSPLEQIRRLQVKQNWDWDHNAVERIKYERSGIGLINTGESSATIQPVTDKGETKFVLTNSDSVTKYWTFSTNAPLTGSYKEDEQFDTDDKIEHSNHVDGEVTLKAASTHHTIGRYYPDTDNTGPYWHVALKRPRAWGPSTATSGFFYVDDPVYLTDIGADIGWIEANTKQIRMRVYQLIGDMYEHPPVTKKWIENSGWYEANAMRDWNTSEGIRKWTFSGSKLLTKGAYCWILEVEPIDATKDVKNVVPTYQCAGTGANMDFGAGVTQPGKGYTEFNYNYGEWEIPYPNYDGATLVLRPGHGIIQEIHGNTPGFYTKGTITSKTVDTSVGIASVSMDVNITLPEETSYTLWVSNDDGVNFYKTTNNKYKFSNTAGKKFKYKIELATSNILKTPEIKYNATEGYAIKANIVFAPAQQVLKGSLVTNSFDGDEIANLNVGSEKFSHWEWFQLFMNKNEGSISVDIEATDDSVNSTDATKIWNNIKANLSIYEFLREDVDFGETVEDDEYTYNCRTSPERLITEYEPIEDCEIVWDEVTRTGVTTTADSSIYQEGAKSAKSVFSNYSAQNEVFMSKAVTLDLTKYDAISVWMKVSTTDIHAGDLKFVIGKTSQCATGEHHKLPAITVSDGWKNIIIPIYKASELNTVVSLGLYKASSETFNGNSIYIDNIQGIVTNTKTIENGEDAWAEVADTANLAHTRATDQKVTGDASAKVTFTNYSGTDVFMAEAVGPYYLSSFKQIRLRIRSTRELAQGDIQFILGKTAQCATGYAYNIPHIKANEWITVVFNIRNEEDISTIVSLGLKKIVAGNWDTGSIWIDQVEALKDEDYPFYQRWVRFRINMSRASETDVSPELRKVGTVEILE